MKKYVMSLERIQDGTIFTEKIDRIGGQPTYLPPNVEEIDGFFLMEIFNTERTNWNENVLCWQFYQEDPFGGDISEIIEVPLDAKLNVDGKVPKRRWLHEYIINYEEKEEKEDEGDIDESKFGGIPRQFDYADFENEGVTYLGEMFSNILDDDIKLGGMETFVKTQDGKIEIWEF